MTALASLILAALPLAACAGRPQGVLLPVTAINGTRQVEMLVATTRSDLNAAPGEMFSGDRAIGLNFADIAVSIPPDAARQPGEVQWPRQMPADPKTEFATLRAERLDRKAALKRYRARLGRTPHRNVLIFVHGYNTRFEEAVYRLAQIVHDSRAPVMPLLFTWPSRGRLLAYPYDRESANYSRDALEAVLQHVAKDPAVGEVTILAHSMGNVVALEALRQMAIRDGQIASKITHVMLAAPDVDVDVFRRMIASVGGRRPQVTLMVSQDDKALAVSRRVWGSTARLGAIDPDAEPYRSQLAKEHINVIDLTRETGGDSLNHGKFAHSSQVVKLIGRQVAGQRLDDSRPGLGDTLGLVMTSAAQTAGRAASIAISAPIAVFDGRTREGLPEQFEDLGEQAAGTLGSAGAVTAAR